MASRHQDNSRVLIVEDDALAGQTLLKLLAEQQVEARHVTRAHAALEVLERDPFGCLILDLTLPDMDGLEFLQKLRERYGAQIPAIVIYTARALSRAEIDARSSSGDSNSCLTAGADDYLPRPVDPERLLALLHARLGRNPVS